MNKLSDEKKCVILLALTIFMGFLLFYTYLNDSESEHEGIIRLHVIANSDTVGDQALKLKVRDAVIEYMDDHDELTTVEETRAFLKDDLGRLETIANGIIAAEGYDYTADADIGVACGKGVGVVFRHGQTVRKVEEGAIVDALLEEIKDL